MDIDIVVLWVDGNDPEWQKEKEKYSKKAEEVRFRDWDLMKYWFRGIDKFAPWVRKIHFVTYGHLPAFLDTSNPKLHIVYHEDFMPKEALPTFSSHALELNLHRIEGLSEHFIYFNDDCFLTRPVKKEDFFIHGLPCMHFAEIPTWLKKNVNAYESAQMRSLALINYYFPKRNTGFVKFCKKYISRQYPFIDNIRNITMKILFSGYYTGFRIFHVSSSFRKSTFETIWKKEPDLLWQTTLNKFRKLEDVNQLFPLFWQLASGQFIPKHCDGKLLEMKPNNIKDICFHIVYQSYAILCINDSENIPFEETKKQLQTAFEKILPEKSSYEL